jgi:hypothetical protein
MTTTTTTRDTAILAGQISKMILGMIETHNTRAKKPENRMRKVDGMPFGIHPALAALLMMHEMSIELPLRLIYAETLAWHDSLEDTTVSEEELLGMLTFPESLPLIKKLTFTDDANTTDEAIRRGPEISMLKSYDAVCNLFGIENIDDGVWSREKKLNRIGKAERLLNFAQPHYPNLQIWCIGRAIISRLGTFIRWV